MVANCAQLRQSLAHLQSQLNVLTTNKDGAKPDQPKSEKRKKSKSKKSKGEKQAQKSDVEKTDSAKESENSVEELSLAKDVTNDIAGQQVLTQNRNEAAAEIVEKIDANAMENLIQAINMANDNLCNLEVVTDETNEIVNEKTNEVVIDEKLEVVEDEILENLKDENLDMVNVEKNKNEQNVPSENLKEVNVKPPVEVVPNPILGMSHVLEVKSISNEIP